MLNVKRLHPLAGQRYPARRVRAHWRAAPRHAARHLRHRPASRRARSAGARRWASSDHVTFAGLVDNDDVARYAAAADVFVLPSLLEALPTVAVEALASGTPVVSADHPGGVELHEIFGDDVLVVPKGQVAELADALDESLRSPVRVLPATLDLVARHFSPAAVQEAYERGLRARASRPRQSEPAVTRRTCRTLSIVESPVCPGCAW